MHLTNRSHPAMWSLLIGMCVNPYLKCKVLWVFKLMRKALCKCSYLLHATEFHNFSESLKYDLLIEEDDGVSSHWHAEKKQKEKRHHYHSDEDSRKAKKHKVSFLCQTFHNFCHSIITSCQQGFIVLCLRSALKRTETIVVHSLAHIVLNYQPHCLIG